MLIKIVLWTLKKKILSMAVKLWILIISQVTGINFKNSIHNSRGKRKILNRGNTLARRRLLVLTSVWRPAQLPVILQPNSPFSVQQCLKTSADSHRYTQREIPQEKLQWLPRIPNWVLLFSNIWQSWIIQVKHLDKRLLSRKCTLQGQKSTKYPQTSQQGSRLHITRLKGSCSDIFWTRKW